MIAIACFSIDVHPCPANRQLLSSLHGDTRSLAKGWQEYLKAIAPPA
jgi:hypothetical protein